MPYGAGLMTPVSDLETRVHALERMKLNDLREVWRLEWGAPPKLRSLALLRMIIAWRLQAAAEGGLVPGPARRFASASV